MLLYYFDKYAESWRPSYPKFLCIYIEKKSEMKIFKIKILRKQERKTLLTKEKCKIQNKKKENT